MKPLEDIIVKVPEAYKDGVTLKSGLKILFDDNIKQVKDTIRYGEVVSVPKDCSIDVQVGDVLFFHHGIVHVTVMSERENMESPYLIDKEEGLYRVPINPYWPMAYAMERDGVFITLDGVCFVDKIIDKKFDTKLYIHDNEKERKNVGIMEYPCKSLLDKGIKRGSMVIFENDSEYPFTIGDRTYYCMFDRWIIGEMLEDG